jgi:hypothetical protein
MATQSGADPLAGVGRGRRVAMGILGIMFGLLEISLSLRIRAAQRAAVP